MTEPKDTFVRYLSRSRDSLVWKLEGLSDYDVRRPMTPTGTNLLGLVKHVASTTVGYFGEVFDRPLDEPVPWFEEGAEEGADLYASADESREYIIGFHERAWAHSLSTIEALDLDATGYVPWWPPERSHPTLLQLLIHVLAEVDHHAGHADIIREMIDGSAGLRQENSNLPDDASPQYWSDLVARLETIARTASA